MTRGVRQIVRFNWPFYAAAAGAIVERSRAQGVAIGGGDQLLRLEDIGAAAGVSGPAIYRHFPNKERLIDAILDRVLAEVCRLENEGWQFEAAGASFDLLVDRCAGSFRPAFEKLSDEALRAKTVEFRDRLAKGEGSILGFGSTNDLRVHVVGDAINAVAPVWQSGADAD